MGRSWLDARLQLCAYTWLSPFDNLSNLDVHVPHIRKDTKPSSNPLLFVQLKMAKSAMKCLPLPSCCEKRTSSAAMWAQQYSKLMHQHQWSILPLAHRYKLTTILHRPYTPLTLRLMLYTSRVFRNGSRKVWLFCSSDWMVHCRTVVLSKWYIDFLLPLLYKRELSMSHNWLPHGEAFCNW